MSARKQTSKKATVAREPLPDFSPIIDAYVDAVSVVWVSNFALHEGGEEDHEHALFTLRQGVNALKVIEDQLETAGAAVNRIKRLEESK
jgi:hypothetical protein